MFKRFLLLIVALLMLVVFGQAAAHDADAEAHKAIIERLMSEVLTGGNLDLVPEIYAPDFVDHSPFGETKTPDGMYAYINNLRTAMPDLSVETQVILAEDDYLAGRFIVTGTFTGELMTPAGAVPGNGNAVVVPVNHIWIVNDDGLLQESWTEFDNLSFLMQVGVIPMPEDAGMTAATDMMPDWTIMEMSGDMVEASHTNVERVIDEAFNQGNTAVIDELFAEDWYRYTDNDDRESFKNGLLSLRAAMPDFQATAEPIIAEGNWVAFRFTGQGTFENEYVSAAGTIPPTGNPVAFGAIIIGYTNSDGRYVAEWDEVDNLSFYTQLGIIPAAGM